MPTSSACSQLHSIRPLKAKVYSAGAAKQSNAGSAGGAPWPMNAHTMPFATVQG